MMTLPFAEPLHLFSIPNQVLDGLQPRASPLSIVVPDSIEEKPPATTSAPSLNALACTLCIGAVFTDVSDQRLHFRSDWHRYNVKLRLRDNEAEAVDETQFSTLIEGLEDSISGSESSLSGKEESSGEEDRVSALLKRTQLRTRSASPQEARAIPKHPVIWFTTASIPDTQFGIYSVVLPITPSEQYAEELRHMQDGGERGRQWAVFMTAGGHFAGAIIRVSGPGRNVQSSLATSKAKQGQKPGLEAIKHKTFHRYTTRRKQGGSQSVNDNAKGPAKSAGALLRRYGEQALKDDIRALLLDWKDELDLCDRIFIRANTANRRIFLDFDDTPIVKGDDRLRTFPFPTRRPTQSEVMRCVAELTRVKISHLTEEALAAQDQELLDSLPQPKPQPKVPQSSSQTTPAPSKAKPKLSKDEEYQRELVSRLLDMVRKGRLEPLKAFWEKQGSSTVGAVDSTLPDWLETMGKDSGAGGTLLQVASASGQAEVVRWLLEECRADPTVQIPPSFSRYHAEDGETSTAYDLCSNAESRNVFRRLAYAHPDWCDWLGKGRVRSVLTPEMEAKAAKEEAKRAKMRERAREREIAAATAVPEPGPVAVNNLTGRQPAPSSKTDSQRVGGSAGDSQAVAGLTPEMRARIERERRARAAEARLRGGA